MTDKGMETIRDFVRGVSDWRSLRSLGLQIEYIPGMCKVSGKGEVVFAPRARDVATGFVNLLGRPPAMAQWASIILAASAVIDLDNLEGEIGNILINALWDASAGLPLSAETIDVIRSLTEGEK